MEKSGNAISLSPVVPPRTIGSPIGPPDGLVTHCRGLKPCIRVSDAGAYIGLISGMQGASIL